MLKIYTMVFLLLLYDACPAQVDSTSTLTVTVGQDSYFGFYVSAFGAHKVSRGTSITVYTNYWANPAFGNADTGTDFWTEVGGGVDFCLGKGSLHLNPTLGFTYGKVLSGGAKGVLGDGVVPALLISIQNNRLQATGSITLFKSLRNEGLVTTDYLWSWVNITRGVSRALRLGVLTEHFYLARMTKEKADTLYLWIGPSLQVNFPAEACLKISGGYDSINDEYIKVNLSIPID